MVAARPASLASLVAFAFVLVTGCGTAVSGAPDGESPLDASDAAERTCAKAWYRVDFQRACLEPPTLVPGLCEVGATNSKGIYSICARSPDGTLYVASTAGGQVFEGAGWTFGPRGYVEQSRLRLPALPAADEPRCDRALGLLGLGVGSPSVCGADAGTRDASGD